MITPSSGCGLLTAYTAGTGLPAWSGPAPSCGAGAFTLAFNQGNTPPPARSRSQRRWDGGQRSVVGLVRHAACPTERGWATRSAAPPGITINKVDYDASQLQNIADGRGWIGFTYWNGGTAQVHPDGTAIDAAASGPLNTTYWGIELRCVAVGMHVARQDRAQQITVYASRGAGPEHHARCRRRQPVGPGRTGLDLERAR